MENLEVWQNRHGKPYQADLEEHVNNWRAKARDFEGDMNLAIGLWQDDWKLERDIMPVQWEVSDLDDNIIGAGDTNEDKPAQDAVICRAAVILEIRKRGENVERTHERKRHIDRTLMTLP